MGTYLHMAYSSCIDTHTNKKYGIPLEIRGMSILAHFIVLYFWAKVSLCSTGYPVAHTHRDPPASVSVSASVSASASWVLWLKACTTMTGSSLYILIFFWCCAYQTQRNLSGLLNFFCVTTGTVLLFGGMLELTWVFVLHLLVGVWAWTSADCHSGLYSKSQKIVRCNMWSWKWWYILGTKVWEKMMSDDRVQGQPE